MNKRKELLGVNLLSRQGNSQAGYRMSDLLPGSYIPRQESKERECWKFLDWQLNSENDSRLHGQPSFHLQVTPLDSPLIS